MATKKPPKKGAPRKRAPRVVGEILRTMPAELCARVRKAAGKDVQVRTLVEALWPHWAAYRDELEFAASRWLAKDLEEYRESVQGTSDKLLRLIEEMPEQLISDSMLSGTRRQALRQELRSLSGAMDFAAQQKSTRSAGTPHSRFAAEIYATLHAHSSARLSATEAAARTLAIMREFGLPEGWENVDSGSLLDRIGQQGK